MEVERAGANLPAPLVFVLAEIGKTQG